MLTVNVKRDSRRARLFLVSLSVVWVVLASTSGGVRGEEAAGDPAPTSSASLSGDQAGARTSVLPTGQAPPSAAGTLTDAGARPASTPADSSAALTGSTSLNFTGFMGSSLLLDATGRKIVFPITDSNGRVLFQNATELPMQSSTSSRPGGANSTLPSSKAPGDPPKKGAKPNAASLLLVDTRSAAAWLSVGAVLFSLFA